jgi:hypothetical protein
LTYPWTQNFFTLRSPVVRVPVLPMRIWLMVALSSGLLISLIRRPSFFMRVTEYARERTMTRERPSGITTMITAMNCVIYRTMSLRMLSKV